MSEDDRGLLVPNQLVGNDQPIEGQSIAGSGNFETKAMERAVEAGTAAVKNSAHVSKKRPARRGAMSGDDPKKIVEFPKAEITPEERARRLRVEVERLAGLPVVEWMFYLEEVAKKHGVPPALLKKMIEATIKERGKREHDYKAEDQQRERRARREQGQADKEAARARKEAERIKREQEVRQKKLETVFAEIAELPRMTHVARLKEAAARLAGC